MQLTRPRGNIIEKVLRNKNGQLVRAVFCVYETEGRVKARLLHTTIIENTTQVLSLGGFTRVHAVHAEVNFYTHIVSPFYPSNSIYFSGSKPRAPTL